MKYRLFSLPLYGNFSIERTISKNHCDIYFWMILFAHFANSLAITNRFCFTRNILRSVFLNTCMYLCMHKRQNLSNEWASNAQLKSFSLATNVCKFIALSQSTLKQDKKIQCLNSIYTKSICRNTSKLLIEHLISVKN